MRFLRAALGGLAIATQVAGAQSILRLSAGARALGMGNVAVAGRDDDVLFYNPAQLAIARGTTVSGAWDASSFATGALSSAMAFSSGGVGVGGVFSRSDIWTPVANPGPIPGTPPVVLPVRMSSVLATAAVAQVVKGFRIGVGGKYLGEQQDTRYESRTMVDVGLARGFLQYFTGGLAVQNIGISGRDRIADAPTRATLGAAGTGPLGPYDLIVTAAVSMDDLDHRVHPAAGVELGWSWLNGYNVAVRAGLRDPITAQRPFTVVAGEQAFTAGAGFVVDRIAVDYALETLVGSRVGHRIGVRVR